MKVSSLLIILYCCLFINCKIYAEPVALLAPARPHPEKNEHDVQAPGISKLWETDILISLMKPFEYENIDMDIPQSIALLEPVQDQETGKLKMERRDLLGDIEEIRYLNKKAWSINAGLQNSGTNHFTLETKPWWDADKKLYRQFLVKSSVLVTNDDSGWDLNADLSLEIIPLTRPFGLTAPCFFAARVMYENKPLSDLIIKAGQINETRLQAVSPAHEYLVAKTNASGEFAFVFNSPGWWYCEGTLEKEPLKGPDGEPSPLMLSTVFWLYIDSPPVDKKEAKGKR